MNEQTLPEIEVVEKRPFPKLLALAALLAALGTIVFIIDISKQVK